MRQDLIVGNAPLRAASSVGLKVRKQSCSVAMTVVVRSLRSGGIISVPHLISIKNFES